MTFEILSWLELFRALGAKVGGHLFVSHELHELLSHNISNFVPLSGLGFKLVT